MAYRPVEVVEVRIWGARVGAVALDPRLGFYAFEYAPAFIRSGIELAPLTMPLAAAREPFIFPALPDASYWRLPGMLADALPDDFGNALIDAWMQRQGVAKRSITSLDRLAYMGKRGMGALEFRPASGPPPSRTSTAIEMSQLVEGARRTVQGTFEAEDLTEAALAQILQVGTSAGGARAKATVAWNPATNEIRAGQFDVPDGFEHWLLKLDGVGADAELGESRGYGRIEYAYSLMARDAGITMTSCRLLEEHGRAHFMTRRFDRDGNVRHHLQSLCGLAHVDFRQRATHDVSQLFAALDDLQVGYEAREEAFRRVAFNVMATNCDDHTKNWSFLLRRGGTWELSPAYDVTYAHNPKGEWTYQHLMSVNGKFTDITRRDLLAVADRFAIGTAPKVLQRVRAAVEEWPAFAAEARVDPRATARIRENHRLV